MCSAAVGLILQFASTATTISELDHIRNALTVLLTSGSSLAQCYLGWTASYGQHYHLEAHELPSSAVASVTAGDCVGNAATRPAHQ